MASCDLVILDTSRVRACCYLVDPQQKTDAVAALARLTHEDVSVLAALIPHASTVNTVREPPRMLAVKTPSSRYSLTLRKVMLRRSQEWISSLHRQAKRTG